MVSPNSGQLTVEKLPQDLVHGLAVLGRIALGGGRAGLGRGLRGGGQRNRLLVRRGRGHAATADFAGGADPWLRRWLLLGGCVQAAKTLDQIADRRADIAARLAA